jgi:Planctomycete cytochrome C
MLATIKATYQKQQSTVQLKITKKAFQQPVVSYAQTIKPLLANNCNFSGCHANGSRGGKVELSVYDSVKTSVFPFNADASKLYFSLIKTDPLRVMPPAGKLHADKIQSVWLWIEQGALNN